EVVEAVEAVAGDDPDVAFAILEDDVHEIGRETVDVRERVRAPLMHVHEPSVHRCDPAAAVAIAKDLPDLQGTWTVRERIPRCPPVHRASDLPPRADQERAVVVFGERLETVRLTGERVERRRRRLPSPDAVLRPYPELAPSVLVQAGDAGAEASVVSV